MAYRIALIGGGSGGHSFPLVAIAKKLKELGQQQGIDVKIQFIGSGKFLKQAAKEAGVSFRGVLSGKRRRYTSSKNFFDIIKMPFGLIQSLWHLLLFMPDVVLAKGGYGSVLPSLAAKFYAIPLYLHESDSVPGSANLTLSRFAKKIFISFEGAAAFFRGKNTQLVGNPIREELLSGNRGQAVEYFKLDNLTKTILFLGGSQGAQILNNFVINSLVSFTDKFQIIHQVGRNNFNDVSQRVNTIVKEGESSYGEVVKKRYRIFPFLNVQELAMAYSVADIVVTRAGAVTIAELAALGKPSLIIPLAASASDHQRKNAYEFQKYGAIVIEEGNLKTNIVTDQINDLLADPDNYAKVSANIKSFAKLEAATVIAQELLSK